MADIARGRHVHGPKHRKHYSYDESVDEPAPLIEDEAVEIEEAIPADENEPMQQVPEPESDQPPAFEE